MHKTYFTTLLVNPPSGASNGGRTLLPCTGPSGVKDGRATPTEARQSYKQRQSVNDDPASSFTSARTSYLVDRINNNCTDSGPPLSDSCAASDEPRTATVSTASQRRTDSTTALFDACLKDIRAALAEGCLRNQPRILLSDDLGQTDLVHEGGERSRPASPKEPSPPRREFAELNSLPAKLPRCCDDNSPLTLDRSVVEETGQVVISASDLFHRNLLGGSAHSFSQNGRQLSASLTDIFDHDRQRSAVRGCTTVAGVVKVKSASAERRKDRRALKLRLVDMVAADDLRGIPMHAFEEKLREWKMGPRTDDGLPARLLQQFVKLKSSSPDHSKQAAQLEENKLKNRYTNILPFDHSRVKLVPLHDEEPTSDYINANYIAGYYSKREYIATQGPLARTVGDFWRMVFEQQSPIIVMLSALTEGRLEKVYRYYPDDDQVNVPCTCGMVTVTLLDIQHHDYYVVRSYNITLGRMQHAVKQFMIGTWKDFEANLHPGQMLSFVRAVRQAIPRDNRHPIVVHCSAGVGRTGTYIAIDYFANYIRQMPPSAPIDIYDFVLQMRDSRLWMVQAAEQYVFIHDVVAELIRHKLSGERFEPLVASTSRWSRHNIRSESASDNAQCSRSQANSNSSGSSSDATVSDTRCPSSDTSSDTAGPCSDNVRRRSSMPSERQRRSNKARSLVSQQPAPVAGTSGHLDRRRHSIPASGGGGGGAGGGRSKRRTVRPVNHETAL